MDFNTSLSVREGGPFFRTLQNAKEQDKEWRRMDGRRLLEQIKPERSSSVQL